MAEYVKTLKKLWTSRRFLEMPDKTPGGVANKERPEGPLMFQGNHGPVAYRNIVTKPLKK